LASETSIRYATFYLATCILVDLKITKEQIGAAILIDILSFM